MGRKLNAKVAANANRKKIGIQVKVLGILLPIVAVAIIAILIVVQLATSQILKKENENLLASSAEKVANEVDAWSSAILASLETEAQTIEYNDKWSKKDQKAYQAALTDPDSAIYSGMYVALSNGDFIDPSDWVPDAGYDPTAQGWYQQSVQNDVFAFGDPYVDEDTGNMIVTAGRALKAKDGSLRGVAAGDVDLSSTSEVVAAVRLEKTGGAYLVDSVTGIVIGAGDSSVTGNTLDQLPADSVYGQAAQWISSGSMGSRHGKASGKTMYFYLQQVPNSNWVTVCYVPEAEIMASANALTRTLIIIAVVAIIILGAVILILMRRIIINPVKKLDAAAQRIADGDLNTKVDYHSNDEFGALADNFGKTANRLHSYVDYINEISDVLKEVAHGNLNFRLSYDYAGEFAKIKTALQNISESLNDTISQIDNSSQRVSEGAGSLSSGAQTMAQGATEQAASVVQLSETINDLSERVNKNATDAKNINKQVNTTAEQVEQSNERMQELIRSMDDINNKSMEIDKVIKIIESIAFQTNILALNAAVEAARAGTAGKGFAVVADEVRNLAMKSQDAAKSTANLIKASVDAVQHGSEIADETATSLVSAAEDIEKITNAVNDMAEASELQAESIAQVSEGISQIADVVQNNSATSQETAAASEDLSKQSKLLKSLVEKFTLKE